MSFENQSAAFSEALDYVYSFINFEKKKQDRYMASKIDATRPKRLLDKMGSPYQDFPAIHIAGTKGKGSVSAMCAFALRAAGLRVGLYTSPHLIDFRERIRILTPNDKQGLIPEAAFVSIIDQLRPVIADFPEITWFEVVTAVAFQHFSNEQVDIAVVEVGLGGRLDATNILSPLVSVITSLSLDHTQFLGNTLAQIAFEKGGIIKPGIPVIVAPQPQEASEKLRQIAVERGAPIAFLAENWQVENMQPQSGSQLPQIHFNRMPANSIIQTDAPVEIALLGAHQIENGVVAIATLSEIADQFPALTETAVRQGLRQVEWNGRLQILNPANDAWPTILVDCAHNPDSAQKLVDALTHLFTYERLWLVLGAPADKDVAGMLQLLLPMTHKAIFTTANHPRSISPESLVEMAKASGYESVAVPEIGAAVKTAVALANPGDIVCITGSIIVVGDLLNQWERLQSSLMGDTKRPSCLGSDNRG